MVYVYDTVEEAQKVARTLDRTGCECERVGSAVLCSPEAYAALDQTMAPAATVAATVQTVA